MGGIETIESQAGRGHLIEHRRFQIRMTVVTGFLPTVVVSHEQDDVRTFDIAFGFVCHQSVRHKDCRKDE